MRESKFELDRIASNYGKGKLAIEMGISDSELSRRLSNSDSLNLRFEDVIEILFIIEDPAPLIPLLNAIGYELKTMEKTNTEIATMIVDSFQKAVGQLEELVKGMK
jgi:hypothetical protein